MGEDLSQRFVGDAISRDYACSRPRYTEEMFRVVSDRCRQKVGRLGLAVDVGCGPGNSTIGFCKYFEKVIGVDVSETQISLAPANIPNCQFMVGYSHSLPFIQTGSVDLFCSGLSFHFMPQKETFAEADRVLRPGGMIAIFGYAKPMADNADINTEIQMIFNKMLERPFKPFQTILNNYADVNLPYPSSIEHKILKMVKKTTVRDFMTLVASYAVIKTILVDEPDFLEKTAESLATVVKSVNGGEDFEYYFDIFLHMCQKPTE